MKFENPWRWTAVVGLVGVVAAQAAPRSDGVTVVILVPAEGGSGDVQREALADLVESRVNTLAQGPVVRSDPAVPLAPLLEDVASLPARLAALARDNTAEFPTRYLLCVRVTTGAHGDRIGEVAAVDLAAPALLGFKAVRTGATRIAEEAAAAALALTAEVLPVRRDAAETAPVVAPLPAEPAAAHVAGQTWSPRPAALRPLPEPAPEPDVDTKAVTAPSLAVVDLDDLLRSYAGSTVALGGLGTAVDAPRFLESSQQLVLTNAAGAELTATVSVFAVGDDARVELRLPCAAAFEVGERKGSWLAADLDGLTLPREEAVAVNRSGLLSVHVKPADEGCGIRVGFQLTPAGELDVEASEDGCRLVARAFKNELAVDDGNDGGDLHVTRTTFGKASWYGARFHGRRTASGERFDPGQMTAAHRSLPFGTRVRITNLHNNRTAVLRINDRGPFERGRILDVSSAAAEALGFRGQGVARIKLEILDG